MVSSSILVSCIDEVNGRRVDTQQDFIAAWCRLGKIFELNWFPPLCDMFCFHNTFFLKPSQMMLCKYVQYPLQKKLDRDIFTLYHISNY
jgi:hypothetical protein